MIYGKCCHAKRLPVALCLKGKIGFRYSGLGLYQFKRVTENSIDQLAEISDYYDRESDNENTQVPEPKETLTTNETIVAVSPQPKIVGKIDISQFEKKSTKNKTSTIDLGSYEDGEIVHGTICLGLKSVVGPKGRCTVDKKNGFAVSPKNCDYEAIKNVVFKVKIGKNTNDPSLPWYYATNIQPDE